jgi:uncharacterized low-complexity protein
MFLLQKVTSYTLSAILLGAFTLVGNVTASDNPFAMQKSTANSIQLASCGEKHAENEASESANEQTAKCGAGKCGSGKCGSAMTQQQDTTTDAPQEAAMPTDTDTENSTNDAYIAE